MGGERLLEQRSSSVKTGICLIGEGGRDKGVEEGERSSTTSVGGVGGRRERSNSTGVSTLDLLGVSGFGVGSLYLF